MSRIRTLPKNWATLGIAAVFGLVVLANAHLLYVAFKSQPDCIDHVRPGLGTASEVYAAARSSCTPAAGGLPR